MLDLAEEFKLEFAGDSISKDEQLPVAFEFGHDSPGELIVQPSVEPEFHGADTEIFLYHGRN